MTRRRAFGAHLLVWRASDGGPSERQSPLTKRLIGQASTRYDKRTSALFLAGSATIVSGSHRKSLAVDQWSDQTNFVVRGSARPSSQYLAEKTDVFPLQATSYTSELFGECLKVLGGHVSRVAVTGNVTVYLRTEKGADSLLRRNDSDQFCEDPPHSTCRRAMAEALAY
jgi:hypothetical protein